MSGDAAVNSEVGQGGWDGDLLGEHVADGADELVGDGQTLTHSSSSSAEKGLEEGDVPLLRS
jgi:hypothetical protein